MLNRLKSLPLTLLLTILIWMYAEAQFTSTREGVLISLNVNSPAGNYAVRVQDPSDGQYHQSIPLHLSLEGPQNKIDSFEQASRQSGADFDSLAFSFEPPADALHAGGEQNFDTLSVLNSIAYFRDNGLTVLAATPARLRLQVHSVQTLAAPIVFRSSSAPDAQVLSISAGEAKISIPPELLEQLGGPGHLTVVATPLHDIAGLPPDLAQTVPARLSVDYPGTAPTNLITVTPAQVSVTLRIPSRRDAERTFHHLRVRVLGPPDFFDRTTVELDHPEVDVVLAGPAPTLQTISDASVCPYITMQDGDDHAETPQGKVIRYQLPEGIRVLRSTPEQVVIRALPHALVILPATTPATRPAAPR